jgi:hypothetical protein
MVEELHELPSSPLVDHFCENLAYLREDLHARFREACLRHRPVPAEEANPSATKARSPNGPRSTSGAHLDTDDAHDMVLPIYIGTGDAHATAREAVIRSWAVHGPERLFFRR